MSIPRFCSFSQSNSFLNFNANSNVEDESEEKGIETDAKGKQKENINFGNQYGAAIANPLIISGELYLKLCRLLNDCLLFRPNDCFHSLPTLVFAIRSLFSTLGSFCHIFHTSASQISISESQLLFSIRSSSRLLEDFASFPQITKCLVPSLFIDLLCKFPFSSISHPQLPD